MVVGTDDSSWKIESNAATPDALSFAPGAGRKKGRWRFRESRWEERIIVVSETPCIRAITDG